jgi:hypothetical protein
MPLHFNASIFGSNPYIFIIGSRTYNSATADTATATAVATTTALVLLTSRQLPNQSVPVAHFSISHHGQRQRQERFGRNKGS